MKRFKVKKIVLLTAFALICVVSANALFSNVKVGARVYDNEAVVVGTVYNDMFSNDRFCYFVSTNEDSEYVTDAYIRCNSSGVDTRMDPFVICINSSHFVMSDTSYLNQICDFIYFTIINRIILGNLNSLSPAYNLIDYSSFVANNSPDTILTIRYLLVCYFGQFDVTYRINDDNQIISRNISSFVFDGNNFSYVSELYKDLNYYHNAYFYDFLTEYQRGYKDGYNRNVEESSIASYNDGYSDGVDSLTSTITNYEDIIESKDSRINELLSELNSDDRINFRFYDLLNNVFKYPFNLVTNVFYHNGEPIQLFGINIIGVVVGVIAIGLCITIISVVKKVWN